MPCGFSWPDQNIRTRYRDISHASVWWCSTLNWWTVLGSAHSSFSYWTDARWRHPNGRHTASCCWLVAVVATFVVRSRPESPQLPSSPTSMWGCRHMCEYALRLIRSEKDGAQIGMRVHTLHSAKSWSERVTNRNPISFIFFLWCMNYCEFITNFISFYLFQVRIELL